MTITPASVDGFPKTGRPWNNITPFTYRDGLTYLEVLEALRAYVRDYLVQHINDELNGLVDDWQEQVTIIENAVSDALAQHSQEMHELADRWMQEQIENNDEITANILKLASSLTKTALEPVLVEYVAQAGSVQDAVDNRARVSVEQAVVGNTTLREAVDNRARVSVEQAVVENTTLREAVDSRARTSVAQAVAGNTPVADAVSDRAVSAVNSAITETGELSDTLKQETLSTAAEGATNVTAFRDAIDQRVTIGTADAISTALADSQTLVDAAVTAVSDAVGPALDSNYPSLKPSYTDNLGNDTNLNNVVEPKRYKRTTSVPSDMNYPDGAMHGLLDVIMVTRGTSPYVLQVWTDSWNGFQANRRLYTGVWTAWRKLEQLGTLPARVTALESVESGSGDELGVRRGEHDMRLNGLRQRIGKVSHPGKAVVAFVCDHGSLDFQNIVLPKLRQHGMKSTLAMCSTQLTIVPSVEVDSWTSVIEWATNDGVEVACHSETHEDVTGVTALRAEIIESRDSLSANLGGLPVDTWVQPAARNLIDPVVGGYDGFKDGQGADRYYSTPAGEMIWNGYAFSTGLVSNQSTRVYPCTGEPPLGPARRFIDGGADGIATANEEIDAAVASGGRHIVSLHPQSIRSDGRTDMITQAQIEAFIDSLAAREAAGEIVLVQLREWALADTAEVM